MTVDIAMLSEAPACRQCGQPSPFGDPCNRCKLENLADFMIEETLAMTDEEIMAETSPAEIEDMKAILARAINGEVVCSFNPDLRALLLKDNSDAG